MLIVGKDIITGDAFVIESGVCIMGVISHDNLY